MITYVKGDATRPVGNGPRVIPHIVNNIGKWGKGFVLAVSKRWKGPAQLYRAWHKAGSDDGVPFALGEVQFVQVEPDLWIANMVAQEGIGMANGPPIRYEALEKCLVKVAAFAKDKGASLHGPRFGSGLAGGQWSRIEQLINTHWTDLNVTIYDFTL